MKLVSVKCPNCGAVLKADEDLKNTTCDYCRTSFLIDDEVKHIQLDGAEQAGYDFEKGRQRAQQEMVDDYAGVAPQEKWKDPRFWLWVAGWICIFPVPLMILLLRNNKMNQSIKIAAIVGAWAVYLLIGIVGVITNKNKKKDILVEDKSAIEVDADSSSESEDSNIKEIAFDCDSLEVMEGNSLSNSVHVEVEDKDLFSPEDVIFKSGDEEIAKIKFEKQGFSTYLDYIIDGINPGETEVYAVSKDGKIESEHIKVTVTDDGLIDPEAISLKLKKKKLVLGETASIVAKVSPKGASYDEVKWESSNEKVVTVDEKGDIKAVGGGLAKVTASISEKIHASCKIKVNGKKRKMSLFVSHPRKDNNSVGNEWKYVNKVNGKEKYEYVMSAGDVLNLYSEYTEIDDTPETGRARKTYKVTKKDLKKGFIVKMDLYVTENAGRYSGKSAHFVVAYTFSAE